jgi:hypothetical protein
MLQSFYEWMIVLKTRELTGKSAPGARAIGTSMKVVPQPGTSRDPLEGFHAHSGSNY